ncbi:biotin--[acetyl-CoA-carboxylase] ligase [Cellulomonas sp. PSBB021]|uniref:biotin--[acetyl-CoA-carboxylase] ligase n=1 Tax=Cellulomonas sp. PSBB021 TaxID=2003551 RepID=UPI000B8D1ECD|nr:biotin--[acetyl-CoA-carboxylase] ligase [Cellulomonas sp. PSBB021]ASR53904.1 biotin--[acetyl-CoA-carboxylase] ligase [Cellulomonas sp. PSBB021]
MTTRPALDPDEVRALLQRPDGPLTRVEVVASTGSTNADVVHDLRADPQSWPDRSLLVADHQVAGKGRRDRTWQTPAGAAVTCSFVVHLGMPSDRYGWLPLLAGMGAVRAVRATAGVAASLKWPNDVLVPASGDVEGWGSARKVGGVLCELVPLADGTVAAVVGIGLNVLQTADELPVPSAGSLALAGARHVDRLAVLVGLVEALEDVESRWDTSGGAVQESGLADEVASVLSTLGTGVAVDLPGGDVLEGVAVRLDDDGALVVRTAADDERRVLAGDVRHLRTLA